LAKGVIRLTVAAVFVVVTGALNWLTLILAYATIFTGLWVMVLPWYGRASTGLCVRVRAC
jgi:hypothetical protein